MVHGFDILGSQWQRPPLDNRGGLVTLIGDACHPMTYQRGQGLNHPVTDASELRDALVKVYNGADRASTIGAFEDEMIGRGGREVKDGNANTMLLHDWEKVKQSSPFTNGLKKNSA
jgi:2-polyprenyl-6-methoxyphenol hydroxylase-like FAD-dependent oxidoreductase